MCLASRLWTLFKSDFGDCDGFAIHEHTQQDIETYVRDQLRQGAENRQTLPKQDSAQRLIGFIANRALGVFKWVRLVIDLVSKGLRDGTPYSTLEEQMNRMPQELKALYADTLQRIKRGYRKEAYIMLQTVLCSLVPLPLDTFVACLDMNAYDQDEMTGLRLDVSKSPLAIAERTAKEPTASMNNRLISRSGEL